MVYPWWPNQISSGARGTKRFIRTGMDPKPQLRVTALAGAQLAPQQASHSHSTDVALPAGHSEVTASGFVREVLAIGFFPSSV